MRKNDSIEEKRAYYRNYYHAHKKEIAIRSSRYANERYRNDPEYRERKLKNARERYQRIKAEHDAKTRSA